MNSFFVQNTQLSIVRATKARKLTLGELRMSLRKKHWSTDNLSVKPVGDQNKLEIKEKLSVH